MSALAKQILKHGIIWIVLLSLFSWFVFPWEQVLPKRYSPARTQWQNMNFQNIIYTHHEIKDSLIIFEQQDKNGNYLCKAKLAPDFDEHLPKIVEAYNNDPTTSLDVSEAYVRFYLTERIGLTAGNHDALDYLDAATVGSEAGPPSDAFCAFKKWLVSNAPLVFTQAHEIHSPGQKPHTTVTNYQYLMSRYTGGSYADCLCALDPKCLMYEWEYTELTES